MTKEEMLKVFKEHKQKMQLEFVDDLLDRVEHYADKTIKKDYKPSQEEREKFAKMLNIFKNINKYL